MAPGVIEHERAATGNFFFTASNGCGEKREEKITVAQQTNEHDGSAL
jgi:hypothetical protein